VPHIWRSFIAPDVGNYKLNPPFLNFPEYLIEEQSEVRDLPRQTIQTNWVPHIWRSFIAPDVGSHTLTPPFLDSFEHLISKKSLTTHVRPSKMYGCPISGAVSSRQMWEATHSPRRFSISPSI
jgi:hypothetical protein